jgi:steroid 5-alpha reductase family enzyme
MRVSGVTLLEKTLNQRPGYAEYAARTNAFFPWFPKQ